MNTAPIMIHKGDYVTTYRGTCPDNVRVVQGKVISNPYIHHEQETFVAIQLLDDRRTPNLTTLKQIKRYVKKTAVPQLGKIIFAHINDVIPNCHFVPN